MNIHCRAKSIYIIINNLLKELRVFLLNKIRSVLPLARYLHLKNKKVHPTKHRSFPISHQCITGLEGIDWSSKEFKTQRASIVCNSYGTSSLVGFSTIETWALDNNRGAVHKNTFLREQYLSIAKSIQKNPRKDVYESYSLLPYCTSQFGHFIGDCLGQILFFSEICGTDSKFPLLITYPSGDWKSLLEKLCPVGSIKAIHPNELKQTTLRFKSECRLFPRLSSWQNIQIASSYIRKALNDAHTGINDYPEKIFLTTQKRTRISNINEVSDFLSSKGYSIINPAHIKPFKLLTLLNKAKELICEQGSVHQNVLISRDMPYILLTSQSASNQSNYEFECGGIYTMFHWHIINPLYCKDYNDSKNLHPYSRPIHVEIDALSNLIE